MRVCTSFIFLLLSALVLPLDARAAAGWPMYQMTPAHNPVLRHGPSVHWIVDIEKKNNGGLALADGNVYYGDFSGKVTAVNATTGNRLWSTSVGYIVMSTPVVAENLVFVGTGKNGRLHPSGSDYTWGQPNGDAIVALNKRNGRIVWKYHTIGEDMPSPAYVDGRLVFANGDQHAYALDARTGRLLWKIPIKGISTMASATAVGRNVLLASCTVQPYACETILVDSRNGHTIWRAPYGGSDCSPTAGGGMVFVSETSDAPGLYNFGGIAIISALDLSTGKLVWQYQSEQGPYTALASSERTITGTYVDGIYYQALPLTSEMIAFDAATGKIRWRFDSVGPIKQSPVVRNHRLYVGDTSGLFYTLDAVDGHLIHGAAFDQAFSTAPPLLYGGTILVTAGHDLYAFQASRGEY